MKMTITAAGDSILIQGYQKGGYPGFSEVRDYIAKGQARIGNLETCVTDWDTYCSAYSGGTWMNCEPRVLDQILDFGFNFLGFANNHTMDYGPDGLLETVANVKKRGIAIAGAGKDLNEASIPVFRDFPAGRVAFISISSSFNDAARAGYATRATIGRPGLNALRSGQTLYLNKEHFELLKEIARTTELNGTADKSRANGFRPPLPEGVAEFGSISLRLAEDGNERVHTACNKRDLARVKDAITDARYIADYVVIMFHSHQNRGSEMTAPAEFAEEFSRFCLDNGADAIIGTGTHQFKPIEIYKGKPIFYSLGNFCFQSNMVEHQPDELRDKFNFGEMTDIQALAARNKGWTIGHHTQPENFLTVIPYLEFEDGKLTYAEMKPVELGFEKPRSFKGIPYPADEKATRRIFDELSTLSAPYGTSLSLNAEGNIVIKL